MAPVLSVFVDLQYSKRYQVMVDKDSSSLAKLEQASQILKIAQGWEDTAKISEGSDIPETFPQ